LWELDWLCSGWNDILGEKVDGLAGFWSGTLQCQTGIVRVGRSPMSFGTGIAVVVVVKLESGDLVVGGRSGSGGGADAIAVVGRARRRQARSGLGSVVKVVVAIVFFSDAVLYTKLGRTLESSNTRRGLVVIARSVSAACRLAWLLLRMGFCRGAARAV
jgi:hypothetical protein